MTVCSNFSAEFDNIKVICSMKFLKETGLQLLRENIAGHNSFSKLPDVISLATPRNRFNYPPSVNCYRHKTLKKSNLDAKQLMKMHRSSC